MKSALFIDAEVSKAIGKQVVRLDQRVLMYWALLAAERTLHIFEGLQILDDRPSLAIKAGYGWLQGVRSMQEARQAAFAAHAAAREIERYADACAAARSCGHAAATAHVRGHAFHASTYAAKAVYFHSAGDSFTVADERKWQYDQLLNISVNSSQFLTKEQI